MRRMTLPLVLMLLLCLALPATASGEEGVTLVCLNVGKADCLLLTTGDKAFLIDTGYDYTYPALEAMLKHYGVSRLDGVFLTHCHEDHEGGLDALSKSDLEIGAWYAPAIYTGVSDSKHPAVLAAQNRNDTVTFLSQGNVVDAGGGAAFTVLGPLSEDSENENNNSLVMRFDSPHGSILLTGDMKADEEAELLYAKLIAPADVLKVGHHGDSGATTASLLTAVSPKIALISTRNAEETDTPAPSTLYRLKQAGAQTYVTEDTDSAIEVTLRDGEATAKYAAWEELPAKATGIALSIDTENDLLTLKNTGDAALALKDCTLVSVRGGEWFALPDITITPGGAYLIGSKTTKIADDMKLPDKRVWHKSKRDVALLCDAFGRLIAVTENGLPE